MQGHNNNGSFRDVLESLIGEFLVIIVKSGQGVTCGGAGASEANSENKTNSQGWWLDSCCEHEGTLCQVGRDYVLLINYGERVFIPIDAIAAVIED